jgi:hypothetical protein
MGDDMSKDDPTNAERQARWRAKRKKELEELRAFAAKVQRGKRGKRMAAASKKKGGKR